MLVAVVFFWLGVYCACSDNELSVGFMMVMYIVAIVTAVWIIGLGILSVLT